MGYAVIKGNSVQDNFSELDKSQEITEITVHGAGKNLLITGTIADESVVIKNGENRVCLGKIPYNYYEEKEKVNMDKFLDLKEKQEREKVNKDFEDRKMSLIKDDKIYKMMFKLEQEINEIYEAEKSSTRLFISELYFTTPQTTKKIKEIEQEKDEKIAAIEKKYEEIKALCEGANHTERMEIYKMYGLIEG